jgi:hypothetical protein
LFWKNPPDVTYNEFYFSSDSNLVINLDPSVKILSGIDSTIVYDSLSLELIGILENHKKYYWRVVEFNSLGQSAGPVWYFITQGTIINYWEDYFNNGLFNYTIIEPPGASWDISNTSYAGRQPPELRFYNSMNFNDASYLIRNNFFDLSPTFNAISLNYSVDWQSGQFTIGVAFSLDEGLTWIPAWQQVVTEDVPANQRYVQIHNENYVKLTLYCISTIPNSTGYWYIDDFFLVSALTVSLPPAQIRAVSDSNSQKVFLSWGPGYTINPSWGYVIQRKSGLPTSSSTYYQIAWVGPNVLSLEDSTVQLDSIYTYRIQSREGPGGGFRSTWSNEATAYVPEIVPVELINFTASVHQNKVTLNWTTATETNNQGFEIERASLSTSPDQEWKAIGFVNGHGTTTEPQFYSFTDELLQPGNYQYRLKQIDFDGSFEYSKIVEVTVGTPTKFSLSQNYPNPFNPATKIKFTIPLNPFSFGEGQGVMLVVYDVLGNEIATLVNEELPAGEYDFEFNASGLTSGLYFYTLTAGNYSSTKKMTLMR